MPLDLDNLGRTEHEHSYIAVVHADGDGMGDRIRDLGKRFQRPEQNDDYAEALSEFSRGVDRAAQRALRSVLARLMGMVTFEPDGEAVIEHTVRDSEGKDQPLVRIELRRNEDGIPFLPFRPIVFGGDDVAFICDGRLGISLALAYQEAFARETAHLFGGRITASAGVAIVKTHYPFARAYRLAEQLARSAKSLRRELPDGDKPGCLDWHFALSGITGSLAEIRCREYESRGGRLYLRPVTTETCAGWEHRDWEVVQRGVTAFQGPEWSGRRNKAKALREALREGRGAVQKFISRYSIGSLPAVRPGGDEEWRASGWAPDPQGAKERCGYFDALELSDWFIPLGDLTE